MVDLRELLKDYEREIRIVAGDLVHQKIMYLMNK
jgi:hypothetical protein